MHTYCIVCLFWMNIITCMPWALEVKACLKCSVLHGDTSPRSTWRQRSLAGSASICHSASRIWRVCGRKSGRVSLVSNRCLRSARLAYNYQQHINSQWSMSTAKSTGYQHNPVLLTLGWRSWASQRGGGQEGQCAPLVGKMFLFWLFTSLQIIFASMNLKRGFNWLSHTKIFCQRLGWWRCRYYNNL